MAVDLYNSATTDTMTAITLMTTMMVEEEEDEEMKMMQTK